MRTGFIRNTAVAGASAAAFSFLSFTTASAAPACGDQCHPQPRSGDLVEVTAHVGTIGGFNKFDIKNVADHNGNGWDDFEIPQGTVFYLKTSTFAEFSGVGDRDWNVQFALINNQPLYKLTLLQALSPEEVRTVSLGEINGNIGSRYSVNLAPFDEQPAQTKNALYGSEWGPEGAQYRNNNQAKLSCFIGAAPFANWCEAQDGDVIS